MQSLDSLQISAMALLALKALLPRSFITDLQECLDQWAFRVNSAAEASLWGEGSPRF